jgi:hypothetical protein
MDDIEYKPVPRAQLEIIDKIVELSKDSKGIVELPEHDNALELMFDLFKLEFAEEYETFLEEMKKFRNASINNDGILKDIRGDAIQHQLEIPERFYMYVKSIFPEQKWDSIFLKRLTSILPIFKISNS